MNIQPGVTESLSVNCSLASTKMSGFLSLANLTLYKAIEDSQYIQICSLTSGNVIEDTNAGDGTCKGNINNKGGSYLNVQWLFPNLHMSGQYKCEAVGLSLSWKQVTLTSTATVSGSELSLDTLSEQLRFVQIENAVFQMNIVKENLATKELFWKNLEQNISLLANQNKDTELLQLNLSQHMTSMTQQMTSMTQQMTSITHRIQIVQENLANSLEMLFYKSPVFEGRRYYLAKQLASFSSTSAQATCHLYGGYLAEINKENEFHFVRAFLNNYKQFICVSISGSDEDIEGHWVNLRNNTLLSYLQWNANEPDGGRDQNCLSICRDYNWLMGSTFCFFVYDFKNQKSYICEIPEL
ncbi:C-type lectin domain family 3 member A isoform X2 [Biomphalaria glabrata]|nr:C-type lectin domain family 3 member A isoform X2 [Biomphalaria glabrata]